MNFCTGDSDYQGAMFSVTLPAIHVNLSTVTFSVPILNDDLAECPEEFFLELEIPPAAAAMSVLKVAPDTARVSIVDEDG